MIHQAAKSRMLHWIANASDHDLLRRWRFTPRGSIWFQHDIGDAYAREIAKRRAEMGDPKWALLSRDVGFVTDPVVDSLGPMEG